ncbi:hypothetical protein [Paenibacillus sp. OV219]|uniref:hypothetical protein n=1 Tax=Paenibacillus sp. OV219 TaxID=1884377 RepID=UPI0008D09ED8|nr:hypothetical protein [Paenibacillus sp. OV219]SEP17532.1 hypothetical protein SAMN05518847_12511 [Paenibacillus sp. OV219]
MEHQHIAHLRAIQAKLADAAAITEQDVQDMAMIVQAHPSMVYRALFGQVSARHQAQALEPDEQEPTEAPPTAEQLEAARKAAAVNPSNRTLTAYASMKRRAGV